MTIRTVVEKSEPRFTWLDVVDPTREELSELVARLRAASPLGERLPRPRAPAQVRGLREPHLRDPARGGCRRAADRRHRSGADAEARRVRRPRVRDHDPSQGPALAHRAAGAGSRQRAPQARHQERGHPGPSPDPALQRRAGYLSAPARGGREHARPVRHQGVRGRGGASARSSGPTCARSIGSSARSRCASGCSGGPWT